MGKCDSKSAIRQSGRLKNLKGLYQTVISRLSDSFSVGIGRGSDYSFSNYNFRIQGFR